LQNVSNEIQHPLEQIDSQVESLTGSEGSNLDPQQLESLRVIRENLDRLSEVEQALLALQQANSARDLATVNLVDLARQAIARVQPAAQEKSVTIQAKLPTEACFVQVDIEQLAQVFDAFLTNAVKFSPPNGIVEIGIDQANGNVHAWVSDTGPGIPEAHQNSIFQPFYKPDSSDSSQRDSLGIGLALAKEAIKAHGGEMWLQSQPGSGSTFHFTLSYKPPS
jgi:two-component system sensor histidine kinase VicK